MNSKLKRALQSFKDKIHRVAADRPELFPNAGEETSERLDQLIASVENQATQIEIIQAERSQVEAQLREEIITQLKVIEDLRQGVSRQDDERALLRERLNEAELELRKALDEHEADTSTSRSLTEEYRRLVEEHTLQSVER